MKPKNKYTETNSFFSRAWSRRPYTREMAYSWINNNCFKSMSWTKGHMDNRSWKTSKACYNFKRRR